MSSIRHHSTIIRHPLNLFLFFIYIYISRILNKTTRIHTMKQAIHYNIKKKIYREREYIEIRMNDNFTEKCWKVSGMCLRSVPMPNKIQNQSDRQSRRRIETKTKAN
jgi:hypothetical protein